MIRHYRQELALFLVRLAMKIWPIDFSIDQAFNNGCQEAIENAELSPP